MKELLVRFIREEEGDVVQNVIIIAIFAALALVFGRTIKDFVNGLIEKIKTTGANAGSEVENILGNGAGGAGAGGAGNN